MIKYISNIICALFIFSSMANAQLRKLPLEFTNWLISDGMKHATVSLEVSRITAPDKAPVTIYSYDNERSVQPASVMKLLTTGAVLSLFDPDYKVTTEVYYSGKISENGTLDGNLYLRGHGDAIMGSAKSNFPKDAFAQSVLTALKSAGITHINGNIYGDGTCLNGNQISAEWTWEDMGNYYAQSISGLNFGDNSYTITLNTSSRGHKPSIVNVEPSVDNLVIDNQLLPIDYSYDSSYLFAAPLQNKRVLYGAVPHKHPQFKVKGDVPDPAQFCASQVLNYLSKNNIKTSGKALSVLLDEIPDYDKFSLIYTHHSEPISFIAKQTNVFSVNLFAEMLLRQIAMKYGKGTEADGTAKVLSFWKGQGLDIEGVRMYDGCGLAPADRVTAHFIVNLLNKMQNNSAFTSSFAVAGQSGTVYSFLKKTRLDGKAKLKTGTTKAVIAYSGYATGSDGKTYAISLIVNNHTCLSTSVRKNIEKMFLLLIP